MGKTSLTEAGRYFANADILERKQLFAKTFIKTHTTSQTYS